MEDGVSVEDNKSVKMGACNVNTARLASLQERKKQIEETLAKRNQELRQLCIQEAELTGVTPPEMPLEPGETLPLIRRRVKTAFELSENLVENANQDTLITTLELQIQLHANLAEAALGLANEHMSKTVKRQHRAEYQKHKSQCIALQEKLALLKEKSASEHKQKKKPRVPEQVDDNVSLNTNFNESFGKSDLRHSMRSMKHSLQSGSDVSQNSEQRYLQTAPRYQYRNSEINYFDISRHEDALNSGFYRLSLNGYNKYMERRENMNNMYPSTSYSTHSSTLMYNVPRSSMQQLVNQHSPQYQPGSPPISQHSPHLSQNSPHMSRHSPQQSSHSAQHISQYGPHVSQQHSPQLSQHSPQLTHQRSTQSIFSYSSQFSPDFSKYAVGPNPYQNSHRQTSPSLAQKSQYFSSHTIHGQPSYRQYQTDSIYRNPHQIQPHQQYEQMTVMASGLGGCWKKSESGELVWCNSNTIDTNWQRDKRFGSLDRRKNKRIHKRISPSVDHKSAMVPGIPNYPDQVRNASVKPSQIMNRRSQDNGQLVRTQSLGSVGAQTVDSVYPSDDNSSCESDNRSVNDVNQMLRKHKKKEWLETSLDSPVTTTSPSHAITTAPQGTTPTVLTPEEKYVVVHSPPPQIPPPITTKPPLEIPAESNPSPRVPETNLELFNNNIPKNCTIVQAGHCKPYHEETKPFEMSDFYKYSTKYKKSPVKAENENPKVGNIHRNLNESFEESQKSPFQVAKGQNVTNSSGNTPLGSGDTSGNLNTSLDLAQLAVSDHFSAEMNAWYKDQQKNNNNNTESTPKSRSTATLV